MCLLAVHMQQKLCYLVRGVLLYAPIFAECRITANLQEQG